MTFQQTLDKHLRAIQERNLAALAETLPPDELVLIMADGRLVREAAEFLELHRGWFESKTWSLQTELVSRLETSELAVVVLRLAYRDTPSGSQPIRQDSLLTLVFQRRPQGWVMVHDQNTPIQPS